jgi:hypothetical protein
MDLKCFNKALMQSLTLIYLYNIQDRMLGGGISDFDVCSLLELNYYQIIKNLSCET